jgi:hypothetical protein
MIDNNASNNKSIFRCFGRTFLRTERNDRFYDITNCQPLHDGTLHDGCEGVLVDAVIVSAQQVADLVAHAKRFKIKTRSASKHRKRKPRARRAITIK